MSFNIFLLVICTLLVRCANCQCPTLQGVTFTEIEHTSNKPDCYAIIATPMTWDDASAYCKSVNSLLLAIDRAEEARKIAEHLINEAYDASEWFHLGLRRIESNNPLNIPTGESELGKVGYAWIDGNLFTDNIETYFNEEETDIFEYRSSGASAFQFRLSADQLSSTQGAKHLTLGFKGGNRSASLEVTAKFVCDMDDELICGEKAVPGFLFRDSRMTPALCTASCIADSKTGYAFISGEECYCSSNPSVLTSTTREPCDLPCKGEEWLSCGTTNDDWGMYRRLRFNYQSASVTKDLLRCAQLYGNGLLKKMDFSNQNCSNELSDNYCDRPDYFPVGGKCVFIATADLPRDYQNAQFEMCGKQEHSDMFVLSEASVPEVNTAYPSKFWSKPYSVGESSEGAALAGFHGSLAQEIPWLAGPTLYCEKHVGDLGCVSIADIESGTNVPATGYIKNPSRLVNIYGCIEKCRGLDSAYAAFVTNSSCMCGPESLVNESVMSQSPSECYGTPCPDPGTNQQCPSQVTSARAFNISMYPSLAVSCVELWKNGAYDVGPYRIRLDATESHERFKFLAHCTRVPVYTESSGVIQLSSQTVGHSVPESSQLRPGLFSTDQWDVSGMGFHFNMDAATTLELKFVDGFHLIRGITLLGRGDLDVAGSETYGLKDAFPTGCEVSFKNLTNEWEAAIDAQQPKDKRDVSSVNHTNKGILWTMVLKPKIASAIAVKLTEWENKPIIRVEVIGDSLSSWEKVKRILDQRANETSLGCYGVSKSDRELSSLTLTAIPEYIDTQLEKVKLYCNSLEINLVVAEQYEDNGVLQNTNKNDQLPTCNNTANVTMLPPPICQPDGGIPKKVADGVTTYYCLPHGDYFYDKMDDVSLCEYGRCAELDQSKCDKFRRFVTLHELHDEQNFECSEPPAIPSPSNYAWNGSNLIYHQRSLVCEEPTSEDYGIIETFTCQHNLTWDKDIDSVTFEGCIKSCPELLPINSSANYTWNGTNFINQQMTLVCEEPSSKDYGVIETFTCQQSLQWDKDINSVTFEGCIKSCPEPPPIDTPGNYTWNGTNFIYQQIKLVCEEPSSPDYGIIETFTCQENLTWDKDIDSATFEGCIQSCPEPLPINSSANYTWNGTNFINQQMTLVCEEPSSRDYGVIETFTCQQSLQWDKDINSVTFEGCIKSCPEPPPIDTPGNYTWNGTNFIYQQINLVCEEPSSPDYGIIETFTCQENLTWDKDIDSATFEGCIKSCPDVAPTFNSSSNHTWNGTNFIYQQMTLVCEEPQSPDYGIVETFTCQENLTWDKDIESVTFSDCTKTESCPDLPSINSSANYAWCGVNFVDYQMTLLCDEPSSPDHGIVETFTCQENLTWDKDFESVTLPDCLPFMSKGRSSIVFSEGECPSPTPFPDGVMYYWIGDTKINESLSIVCRPPYEPKDKESWDPVIYKCLENATWDMDITSPELPQCVYARCKSLPPDVANAHHEFYPDTYTDQTKVLEYINYECDEEYEWDFPPGQRALCLADGSWTLQSLLVSKCISENDCDKYIPGFQNTSENLHPDYKYIDSAAYNEFKKKVWKYGSFKEIRCPIGLEFTNARMRTFAYCSSELKGWFLPFGPCYNSRNPGDQVGSLQSGPAFDLRFLPGAILVGIATIVILSCYAMFTVMNRRRRNNLEMDGEDFKPPPTESVALVVQQQPEPPKTQIVEVPAPPKTLQPLALPGPKGRKGAVQASARSMADASMRSCVVDNKSFITMFDDACEPDEDEKPEATTEANQNGGLPLENEQKPEQEDELIAGTKAGSDPRSGPSADTAALAPPAELEPLSPPDEPDTIASSGWSSDKNSSPGFANRDTFAKH